MYIIFYPQGDSLKYFADNLEKVGHQVSQLEKIEKKVDFLINVTKGTYIL